MSRSIRRLLVVAIPCVLAGPTGAEAGFLTSFSSTLTTAKLTYNTCPAVTPVVYATRVSVPSAGSGNACTNDAQCTGAGEACTFAAGNAMSGVCSASGLLSRGDIHYVAGSLLDVEVTIPDCTSVSAVNGVPLLGYSGPDAQSAPLSWSFLSSTATTVNGAAALRQRLRIQFPNFGYGQTSAMTIQVTAKTGGATAATSFQVAGVAAVNAAIRSTVAEQRIRNAFVTGIYEKFGDSEQVFDEDGDRVAYDVDWSKLYAVAGDDGVQYRGSDLRIGTDRLVFATGFRADAPGCDPNVFVDGWFRLVPSGDGVDLRWIREPFAATDAPTWCSLLTVGLWDVVISAFADEDEIAAPFAETIASSFDAEEDGHIKICDLCRVVDVRIGGGKLEVWTIPPTDRVRVTVSTARGTDPTSDPAGMGLIIPAGFYAPIAGGGSVETCVAPDGLPATCDKLVADMDGAFNWWGNDVPVPDSIVYNEYGVAAVLGGRANARARLRGVTRDATKLPAPSFPADSLIARRSATSPYLPTSRARVANGCVLPPVATSSYRISFGVNDLMINPPVRGSLQATVLIAQDQDTSATLFGPARICASEPVSGSVFRTTTTATFATF